MKLLQPLINTDLSSEAYDQFTEIYNSKRTLGEKLRYNHRAVMRLLHNFLRTRQKDNLELAKFSSNSKLSLMDTNRPISVTTNNIVVARYTHVNPRTAQRLLTRLVESNVIIKIFHGREHNFTIILNPLLLYISDLAQKGVFLKPSPNQAFSLPKKTNCLPKHQYYRNNINKIIIHNTDSNKFEDLQLDTDRNKNGNTGKCANVDVNVSPENPLGINIPKEITDEWKQNVAPKTISQPQNIKPEIEADPKNTVELDPGKTQLKIIKANLDRQHPPKVLTATQRPANAYEEIKNMRHSYAVLMVQLMIEYLLPKSFKVNKGYFNEVVEYVNDHYFGNIQTLIGIERAWTSYSARLDDARKFKQLNPNYTPYPRYYFDKTNPKGFDNPQWNKNRNKWKKQKQYQTDQRRLMQSVRAYNANPTGEVYQDQIEKLRKTVQSKSTFQGFFKIVANGNGGQLPKFN